MDKLPASIRDCADPRRPTRAPPPTLIEEALRGQLRAVFPLVPLSEDDPFTHAMRERLDRINLAPEPHA